METKINRFGEIVTKWESNKHPENENFMQRVMWTVWEKPDGKVLVGYKLDYSGKVKFIYGITKDEAIKRYL